MKTIVDATVRGALMARTPVAYILLEYMAANNYQWSIKRSSTKKKLLGFMKLIN